ncbi:Aldehyde/histidinol dehydrogenase [Dactylonectria estremocensis]|uniref:Multifunctional fusion protein n=1 Tax=Dactylonectria estremocensis TaxID=1079267 RepID=A0A9P9FFX8_9HYPO|nr:Aldehyde/histidinol dehydrogenase [Dactylonectria estremocensis]
MRSANMTLPRRFARASSRLGAGQSSRSIATAGAYRAPGPFNEANRHFARASPEREHLLSALQQLRTQLPVTVPNVISGKARTTSDTLETHMPLEQAQVFAQYSATTAREVTEAIDAALAAKQAWQDMSFSNRAAIFLRAADLVTGKYRDELLAATMLGQGKNAWQAEIDAAAELADFYRFNVSFAQQIYETQPTLTAAGLAGRTDWRPLEGFVYAVSPFNFTAIGGNLVSAPAIMGNVVVWKPSPHSAYASYLVHKILLEAGLPPNVIQFVNGDAEQITNAVFKDPRFSALHFTGSSDVFRSLYRKAADGVADNVYRDYPRLVGETSGKNFHLVHSSADISSAVKHTIRAAFEYAGQKCSACSRLYLPASQADRFLDELKTELDGVKVGAPEEFENFYGPVIHRGSFDKITKVIDRANADKGLERVYGGSYDGSNGFFIQPTVYLAKSLDHQLFEEELFGPVLTVHVYEDADFDQLLGKIDQQGGGFALTGAIFASDRTVVQQAEDRLRYSAGNFYVNCKTTGAVIGQQSFGGGRSSGTNDKAGSANLLMRFTSPRTLKEEFGPLESVLYPSNL